MKTIILSLLLSIYALPQSQVLLLFDGGYKNLETKTYLTGITVSGAQGTRIDNLVTMLKDTLGITSLTSAFDAFLIFANESSTLALRNLIKRDFDATAVGSPTFEQWKGYTTANAKYISIDYTPADSVVFKRYSCSQGLYIMTNKASDAEIDCGITKNYIFSRTSGNATLARLWSTTNTSLAGNTNSQGMYVANRTSHTDQFIYKNGITSATSSVNSETISAINFIVGGVNSAVGSVTQGTPSTRQYAVWFVGKGFTADQIRGISNCIEVYMDALGTGVIP